MAISENFSFLIFSFYLLLLFSKLKIFFNKLIKGMELCQDTNQIQKKGKKALAAKILETYGHLSYRQKKGNEILIFIF